MKGNCDASMLSTLCAHEAGHAVMRWLTGTGCTRTEVNLETMSGVSHPTGKGFDYEDLILILLAGAAVESGYGIARVDLDLVSWGDVCAAKKLILERDQIEPDSVSLDQAINLDQEINSYISEASELLCPHMAVIEHLAYRLESEGFISARSMAATMREYQKRMDRLEMAGAGRRS